VFNDNITKLKEEIDKLQKESEEEEEKLETLKKEKARLKKSKVDTTDVDSGIEEFKKLLKDNEKKLEEKIGEYDKANSEHEYKVLLSFLKEGNATEKHIKFVRRMFGLSKSKDDIVVILTQKEEKENYKEKYQKFKVGLGLDHDFLESLEMKDEEIVKHLTRILENTVDFKHILFSEKQKLESYYAGSDVKDLSGDAGSDDVDETVKNLIDILSKQLLTFKGLYTANEYKDKLNDTKKIKKGETKVQYQERVKKVNVDKYPILKHVVSLKPLNPDTNEYEIKQGLVDYLSVKEEELKTLLRILQLYNNCKMLKNKLTAGEKKSDEGDGDEGDGDEGDGDEDDSGEDDGDDGDGGN